MMLSTINIQIGTDMGRKMFFFLSSSCSTIFTLTSRCFTNGLRKWCRIFETRTLIIHNNVIDCLPVVFHLCGVAAICRIYHSSQSFRPRRGKSHGFYEKAGSDACVDGGPLAKPKTEYGV